VHFLPKLATSGVLSLPAFLAFFSVRIGKYPPFCDFHPWQNQGKPKAKSVKGMF